jgi:putative DNA primase/helicase
MNTYHLANAHQVIDAFRSSMREAGIEPPERIIADGVLHRFYIPGQRPGTKNGAYKLFLTGALPAGYFEDFKSGIKSNWKADGPAKSLSPTERQQQQAARQQSEQQQGQRYEQAAVTARRLLDSAQPLIGNDHPYLIKKKIESFGLYRLNVWPKRIKTDAGQWLNITIPDVLLVRLIDSNGRLWNVQAIFAERNPQLGRDKDFLAGGRLAGLFHAIGQAGAELIICEGYATGATLHTATGLQVLCAMSAGNLLNVAKAVRAVNPGKKIIIAADNDEKTPGNPGLSAAKRAALAVRGFLAVPPMAGDFNDMAREANL